MGQQDAGSGLEFREGFERLHPHPIKFPNGKTYQCPMLPLELNEADGNEKALLDALETMDNAASAGERMKLMEINRLKARIVRAALALVYESELPADLGLDVPTFDKVALRLMGGQPKNG